MLCFVNLGGVERPWRRVRSWRSRPLRQRALPSYRGQWELAESVVIIDTGPAPRVQSYG